MSQLTHWECTPVLINVSDIGPRYLSVEEAQNYLLRRFSAAIPHFNIIKPGLIMAFVDSSNWQTKELMESMSEALQELETESYSI